MARIVTGSVLTLFARSGSVALLVSLVLASGASAVTIGGLQGFRERGFGGGGPDGGPVDVLVGPDARMWVLDLDGSLWRLERDVLRRVTRASGAVSRQIVVDGWGRVDQLTEGRKGGVVLRRTWPDGRHDDVRVPGLGSPAADGDLVSDPNGTVWFGRTNDGRGVPYTGVTLDGRVKNLGAVPRTYHGGPGDTLAIGPDGNIWFDSRVGVGRFTPRGRFLPWILTDPDPQGIVLRVARGSDDAVWAGVTDFAGMYRFERAEQAPRFLPLFRDPNETTPELVYWAMAPGPGAAMWALNGIFSQDIIDSIFADSLDPFDANGLLRPFDYQFLPTLREVPQDSPEHYGLTAGLDGRMWFTQRLFGKLEAWRSPFWRPSPRGHARVTRTKRVGKWLRVDLGCIGTTGGYCTGTVQLKNHGHAVGRRLSYAVAAGPKAVNSHIARWLPIPRTARAPRTKLTITHRARQ